MGCGCQPGTGTWDAYLACGAVTPQPLAPDNILQNYAASAGAQSSNFTLCYAVACLKARRLIYWKQSPGDCGASGFSLNQTTLIEASVGKGIGTAAQVDPEPISKGILAGVATILGGFTAAHAQAVATEQTTLCNVTIAYNSSIVPLEQAVKTGSLSPDQASTILSQIAAQLDPSLAAIAKPVNFAAGFRITLKALVQFNADVVFPALAPTSLVQALSPTPPVASPGAAGTYNVASTVSAPGLVPGNAVGLASSYQGASGYTSTPLTGAAFQNIPAVAQASAPSGLPFNITPGELIVIGGIVYLASKPGAVAAAA